MADVTTVVIGAGHAGLAISSYLTRRSIDHVVIERGEVANSWRTERWESLRLLTPNWQSRLPGLGYSDGDPDGFMTMPEVIEFIGRYAKTISAPLRTDTAVSSVRRSEGGYRVNTDDGSWDCRTLVLATGAFNIAKVPSVAKAVPESIRTLTPVQYRSPSDLEQGGVLVVGSSATGTQIADEVHRSGRPVTMAVGEHVRMPRMYRGRDIQWWMDAMGLLDERYDEVDDIERARRVPSPQLVGTADRITLDLNALSGIGVKLVGRFAAVRDGVALLSGSLPNLCTLADLKMDRLLDAIDDWVADEGLDDSVDRPHRFDPTQIGPKPQLELDLASGEIRTIIWATGFRPDYSWLHIPVFDRKGQIVHDGGVVADAPGLYRIGLNFLRRRKSSFIHGASDDARELTDHLAAYVGVGASV